MRRLILYEIKKVFSYRYLLPVLLVFIIISFYQDVYTYMGIREYVKSQHEFYGQYGGILTEKKYDAIRNIIDKQSNNGTDNDSMIEFMIVDTALSQISYMASLRKSNDNILERASDNVLFFKEKKYPALKRANENVLSRYKNVSQPHLIPSGDWKDFFTMNTFLAFPILFIVMLISNIFSKEHENHLYPVIKSSETGLRKTFWAKLSVSGICSVCIMLLFIVLNIIVKSFTSCLYGWDAPVRSIQEFEYSWLNLSILQTVVLFSCCMCFGAFVFGILIVAVSSFLQNNLLSMAIALMYSVLSFLWVYAFKYYYFMFGISPDSVFMASLLKKLHIFLPTLLLEPFYYFENYNYVIIFTNPFETVVVNISITIIVTTLFVWLSYRSYLCSGTGVMGRRRKNAVL